MANEMVTKSGRFYCSSLTPDICKTPVGNSTPPIPYSIIGEFSEATSVSSNIKSNGAPVVVHSETTIPSVKGDNAGSAHGIKSGTTADVVQHDQKSSTVRYNSGMSVRVGDMVFMNSKNTTGTIFERGGMPAEPRIKPAASGAPAQAPQSKSFGDRFDDAIDSSANAINKGKAWLGDKVGQFAKTEVGGKVMAGVQWVSDKTELTSVKEWKEGLAANVDSAVDSNGSQGMMVVGSVTKAALEFIPTSLLDVIPGGEGKALSEAGKAERAAAEAAKLAQEAEKAAKAAKEAEAAAKKAEKAAEEAKKAGEVKKPEEPKEPHDGKDGSKSKKEEEGEGESCKRCPVAGRPVNPVFGCKLLDGAEDLDFELPGIMPFAWQRTYSSDNPHVGWLGQGWNLPFSLALQIIGRKLVILDPQHRGITFSLPEIGRSIYSVFEQITLKRHSNVLFELSDGEGNRSEFMLPEVGASKAVLVRMLDRNDNAIEMRYNPATLLPHTIIDSAGRELTLQFSDAGRLLCIAQKSLKDSDSEGAGKQSLPLAFYEYDVSGDLVRVRDREGQVKREFAYRNHILIRHGQPGGIVSAYEYDQYVPEGKVIRNWTNAGESWVFRYDARETTVIDHLGRETRYLFDDKQRFVGEVDAAGGERKRVLDKQGNITTLIDPAGRESHYWYDGRGRMVSIEEVDGAKSDIAFHDRFDLPVAVTDANRATTTMRYDERGNLIEVIDPLKQSTHYTYNARGLPETITDARGGVKRLAYNVAGQLIRYTDCSNRTSEFEYDEIGNLVRSTDPLGQSSTYQYSPTGKLLAVRHRDGSNEYYRYDTLGRLIAHTDPSGNTTNYQLDLDGKPLSRTNAVGGTLQYCYDPAGRLAQLVNENGAVHAFDYNTIDQLVSERGFDGSLTRLRYDPTGLLVGKVEYGANGDSTIETSFVRNPAGRTIEKIAARLTDQSAKPLPGKKNCANDSANLPKLAERVRTRYEYDALGRMVMARNAESRVELKYDDNGQLIEEVSINHGIVSVLKHAYDELGNRIQTTLPDGRVINQLFYGTGYLHQINIDGEVVSDIERDMAHREINRTQGALTTRYGYDPMGRLRAQVAQLRQSHATKPMQQQGNTWEALGDLPTAQELNGRVVARRYDYDKNGNLSAVLDRRFGLTTFQYDAIGRILGVNHQAQDRAITSERFAFDPAHNLIDARSSVASTNIIADNRIAVWEDKRYAYDGHGNLTNKRIGKHTEIKLDWNAEHQLRSAHSVRNSQHYKPVEQTTHYGYDPFGRRLFKRDAFGVTRFVWDGNRLLAETRGSITRTYLYEPDSFVPLAQVDSDSSRPVVEGKVAPSKAQLYYFHKDHLGTPRELTDADGNLCWAASYKAWGNVLRIEVPGAASGLTPSPNSNAMPEEALQPLRFQGQYYDVETGLHYNRFRYYDPDCGRFVSLDPIGFGGGNNFYQYAPNPSGWIDPFGLACGPNLIRYKPRDELKAQAGARETAINRAWKDEKELIQATGSGTRDWSDAEKQLILNTSNKDLTSVMSDQGYTGHHINSVENGALGQKWKGDPRNIVFLENYKHPNSTNAPNAYNEHFHSPQGHRGTTTNVSEGRLIDRKAMMKNCR